MQPWPFKSMGLFCLSGNTAKLPTKKPVPGQWYFCQTSSGKQDVVLRCRGYTVLCNSLTWEISVGFWHFGVSWSWYFMFTFFLHPSSPVWLQRPIPLGQATGPFCFVGSFLISSALRWTPRAAGMMHDMWDKLKVPSAWAEPWDSHKARRNTHCIVPQMLQRIFQKINILSWQKMYPL